MKRLIFILLTVFLLSSCATTKKTRSFTGIYSGKTPASIEWIPEGKATLTLKQDGSFDLKWRRINDAEVAGLDYTGKWNKSDNAHVWLDFDEVDITIQLSTHAVSYIDREIEFISKDKIKMDNFVLRRER